MSDDKEPTHTEKPNSSVDKKKIAQLMREIHSPGGFFEPIAPSQRHWHKDPTGTTSLQRMWSEMHRGTMAWGRRTPYYSIDPKGTEGHMEHLAQALSMDLANCYRTYGQGEARQLWRKGTREEGERRLYLCGNVPRYRELYGPDAPPSIDAERERWKQFRPHIWEAAQHWTQDKRDRVYRQLLRVAEAERVGAADLIGALREAVGDLEDTMLAEEGVPTKRQGYVKKGETEDERAARIVRRGTLAPAVGKFVQSLITTAQSAPGDVVQNSASLLTSKHKSNMFKSQSDRGSSAPEHSRTPSQDGERPVEQHPVPKTYVQLSPAEKTALQTVFSETARLQNGFKHLGFSAETIDRSNPGDIAWACKLLAIIPVECVAQFFVWIEPQLAKFDRNALGKKPGTAPGPRSLGLLLTWAMQYAQVLDESAGQRKEERAKWIERAVYQCAQVLTFADATAEQKAEAQAFIDSPEEQERSWQHALAQMRSA